MWLMVFFDLPTDTKKEQKAAMLTFIPTYGKVGIMSITDKQFEGIKLFYGRKPHKPNAPGVQLELF